MRAVIECEGAPRDLGRDQGAACRAVLGRAHASASLWQRLRWRSGVSDARSARTARDVARHFPRHAEALEGLARGAEVPRAWLDARLARVLAQPDLLGRGCGIAAAPASGGAFLALALPSEWLLRRARPEGGIPCLEIAPPWFGGAMAAVSEAGVAAAVIGYPAGSDPGVCAAPAALLVQDALHRSESLSGAIDWCLRRPSGGRATLLFADATGEVAGIRVESAAKSVLRPADGLLVETLPAERSRAIAKRLRDGARADAGAPFDEAGAMLARTFDTAAVVLEPATRSAILHTPDARPEVAQLGG